MNRDHETETVVRVRFDEFVPLTEGTLEERMLHAAEKAAEAMCYLAMVKFDEKHPRTTEPSVLGVF